MVCVQVWVPMETRAAAFPLGWSHPVWVLGTQLEFTAIALSHLSVPG